MQQAAYEGETNRRRAEAELAYTLQQNIENQKIKEEAVQIEVVEKQKQIEVQEQEALRKEKELLATVSKPAEAEEYRVRTLANARRYQLQTEATGEADAIRQKGEAEADADRAKGLAEADVLRQKGLAEAEATEKKAQSWQQYTQAAILQQILDKLPEIAAAISQPLSKTDRIVIIGGGEDGRGAGASRITDDVTRIIAEVPSTIEALTGVDLTESLKNLPGLKETPEQQVEAATAGEDGDAPDETPAASTGEADAGSADDETEA